MHERNGRFCMRREVSPPGERRTQRRKEEVVVKKGLCVLLALMVMFALALSAVAEDAVDTAEQAVEEVADTVEQAAEEAADTVEQTAEEAADTVEQTAEEAADTVEQTAEEAADTVEQTAEEAADTVEEAADAAEDAAEEVEEEAESWADTAFEDFGKTKWYVYLIIAVLAVLGVAGVAALGKKGGAKETMSTRVMAEGAMMIAIATVLSMIKIFEMPFGGSVTLFSMLPIVLMSYRHGTKWGLLTAFAHSLLQLIMGIKNVGYCATLAAQIACILLDYVLAFSVLGLAAALSKPIKNRTAGVCVGTAVVCALRFVCHFLSGIFLWGSYKEYYDWAADMPTWLYSLVYNGNYMLLETIITVVGAVILVRGAAKLFDRQA